VCICTYNVCINLLVLRARTERRGRIVKDIMGGRKNIYKSG
jgi:hypothetical protein